MKNLIIAVVSLVVIGAAGVLILSGINNNSDNDNSSNNDNSDQVSIQSQSSDIDDNEENSSLKFSTLNDLIKLGRSYQCTFTQTEEGITNSGKVYTDGTNIRGDYETNINGQNQSFYTIRKPKNTFVWQEGSDEGFIYENINIEDTESRDRVTQDQSLDIDEDINLDCSNWKKDNSLFDQPNNIEFQDISTNIQTINEATNQVEDLKKEACEGIPDEVSKQQCLASFGF